MNSNRSAVETQTAGIPMGGIDAAKLGAGLNTVFKGYAMIFEAMAEQAELLSSVVQKGGSLEQEAEKEPAGMEIPPADTAGEDDSSTPPWEKDTDSTEAAQSTVAQTAKAEPANITVDDLLKVASQKITTNRKNSPKIKALLTSYGCGAISELPAEKREAFLNDLAQL